MWKLEPKKGIPLYVQIVELILSNIQHFYLQPGEKLPPERQLAQRLGVNRSTIVRAFDELAAMQVLVRQQGSGTYVNQFNPYEKEDAIDWRRYLQRDVFSLKSPYLGEIQTILEGKSEKLLDVYTGELPERLIPKIKVPEYRWSDFLESEKEQDHLGYRPLRENMLTFLMSEMGLALQPDELMITSGAQQGLFLILQVLLQAGDCVAVESPSFLYSLSLFQALQIELAGVLMDEEGMIPEQLEMVILKKKVKMVILNPNFQNPTGRVLGVERRKKIVVICQKYQILIVEDDVFGMLYFTKQAQLPTLKSLAPKQVVYLGSLSKVLGTTIKIGWLAATPAIVKRLAAARSEMDFSMSIFPQLLADRLIQGDFQSELVPLRQKLVKCRDFWIQEFERLGLDQFCRWEMPQGGYYLWLEFDGRFSVEEFFYFLLEQEVAAAPHFLFGSSKPALRINFTRLEEGEIRQFVEIIFRWCSSKS